MAEPRTAREGPEAGPDPRIGRVLGGLYRIDARIGEGGMGTVYRATHVHLGRPFAIKVLSSEVRSHSEAAERLRQEAVTASNLAHDHIVDVVSFDHTDDGDVFIVMELLEGHDVHQLLAEGALPFARAVPIAQQIARALGAAHAGGIVHRDLKPENLFVCDKDGFDFVKVLDFGISKLKSTEAEHVRVTRTGQLMGTPLYMSPEQAKGEPDVDLRADVYALGCVLYEMLTGHPPFEGRNYFQLLWKHGNEVPEPPSTRVPDAGIPRALEAVVLRALEKDPDRRFASMAELDAALAAAAPEHALPPMGPTARGSRPGAGKPAPRAALRSRFPYGLVASAVGFAIVAGLAGWAMLAPGPAAPPSAPVPETTGPPKPAPPVPVAPAIAPGTEADADASLSATTPEAIEEGEATVPVTFSSQPPGADVYLGEDEHLGKTPLVVPLPAGTAPIQVRFSLRGYRDEWRDVVPKQGTRVRARLEARSSPGRGGGSLPIKREL